MNPRAICQFIDRVIRVNNGGHTWRRRQLPLGIVDRFGWDAVSRRQDDSAARMLHAMLRKEAYPLFVRDEQFVRFAGGRRGAAERHGNSGDSRDVCTSAQAAAAFYIAETQCRARAFMLSAKSGFFPRYQEAGLHLVDGRPDLVVQGIDRQLTYARSAAAVRHIRAARSYILTNPDLLLPSETV